MTARTEQRMLCHTDATSSHSLVCVALAAQVLNTFHVGVSLDRATTFNEFECAFYFMQDMRDTCNEMKIDCRLVPLARKLFVSHNFSNPNKRQYVPK